MVHPYGKNPGYVITTKFKNNLDMRQDAAIGGCVGLSQYRDECRAHQIPEGHPKGKNPGDVMDWREIVRQTGRLLTPPQGVSVAGGNTGLRGRGKDTEGRPLLPPHHPYRGDGWEAMNPSIANHPVGKNPGDIVQTNPVRQKSWMNTPGHPFTHSYTGKPRDPGDFWEIRPKPFPGAHFAVYPETLCIMPIKSSCPPRGIVLDPFAGSGTTMKVAPALGRNAIGIELNPRYTDIIKQRLPKCGKLDSSK